MGCFTALLSRLVLLGVWIWTPMVNRAFNGSFIIPLLGVIFLPCTALAYVLVYSYNPAIGVTGWGWAWVVLGLILDLSSHGSGAYNNRHRVPRYRAAEES